jgi:hypothetical protein
VNSSPAKPDEAELQPLRRLIHADKCFRTIMRLVKFLESAGLQEDEEAYLPVMAGICFTYAQPFWGNDGLGPLPQKFREFPNQPRFEKIHTALLSGREWLYEHVGVESIFHTGDKKGRIGKVTITLQPGGGVVFDEEDLRWSQQELREIADLCRLQSSRLAPDIKALISDISEGKKYKLGSYVLGETFP